MWKVQKTRLSHLWGGLSEPQCETTMAEPIAVPEDGGEEEFPDDVPVEEVGDLIEGLNSAIDRVNALEDECQAVSAKHSNARTTLLCQAAVLESESAASELYAHSTAVYDAGLHLQRVKQPLNAQEQTVKLLQAQSAKLQAELSATGLWQARVELTSKLSHCRNAITAANKAHSATKKALTSAATKADKARKQLQRQHATVTFGSLNVPPVALPPLDDELHLLAKRLELALQLDAAAALCTAEVEHMERLKELAAQRVSEAMEALEAMSNEIHENRKATMAEAAAAEQQQQGEEDGEHANDGDGGGGREEGGNSAGETAAAGSSPPRAAGSGGDGSGPGSGNDSDFVVDSSDDEGNEGGGGGGGAGGAGGGQGGGPTTPKRLAQGAEAAERKPVGAPPSPAAVAPPLAVEAVARLLMKASDLVIKHGSPQPSAARSAAFELQRLETPSPTEPVHSLWYGGVVWSDSASIARLRAECSGVATQII